MVRKEIINIGRRRKLPEGFGWVDHRLARENWLEKFGPESLTLYLFLVTVGDEDGVSWYSDETVCRKLNFGAEILRSARHDLVGGGLVAYKKPHYQVLELPRTGGAANFRKVLSEALSVGEEIESERRQPSGTEGLGVSLHPDGCAYRRGDNVCDALPVSVIVDAMAGGAR